MNGWVDERNWLESQEAFLSVELALSTSLPSFLCSLLLASSFCIHNLHIWMDYPGNTSTKQSEHIYIQIVKK